MVPKCRHLDLDLLTAEWLTQHIEAAHELVELGNDLIRRHVVHRGLVRQSEQIVSALPTMATDEPRSGPVSSPGSAH